MNPHRHRPRRAMAVSPEGDCSILSPLFRQRQGKAGWFWSAVAGHRFGCLDLWFKGNIHTSKAVSSHRTPKQQSRIDETLVPAVAFLQIVRHGMMRLACRGPFDAPDEQGLKAGTLHRLDVMPEHVFAD